MYKKNGENNLQEGEEYQPISSTRIVITMTLKGRSSYESLLHSPHTLLTVPQTVLNTHAHLTTGQ